MKAISYQKIYLKRAFICSQELLENCSFQEYFLRLRKKRKI